MNMMTRREVDRTLDQVVTEDETVDEANDAPGHASLRGHGYDQLYLLLLACRMMAKMRVMMKLVYEELASQ